MATDPNQAAADWVAGISAKTTKMQTSVQAVTMAPGQAAARQKAAYIAGVQASQDKWARNVGNVTLADWQRAMIEKGIPRVASGASAAQQRMANVFSQLLPHIERVRSGLPARGTYEQNKARAIAMMDGMHAFPGVK